MQRVGTLVHIAVLVTGGLGQISSSTAGQWKEVECQTRTWQRPLLGVDGRVGPTRVPPRRLADGDGGAPRQHQY